MSAENIQFCYCLCDYDCINKRHFRSSNWSM